MSDILNLKAYAKINLGLDVIRQRDDGYHEVKMVMQTVDLFDRIFLERTGEDGIDIRTNHYSLPTNEDNIAYKAAKMLFDEFSIRGGLNIQLQKYIPVAAGMAGGSADAAAVLCGVNAFYLLGLSEKELMERAIKIGADVPYCIMGGTAVSEGIGEILRPLPSVPDCSIVIAKPPIDVSTKYIYENLHVNTIPKEEHPDMDKVIERLENQDLWGAAAYMENILERVTQTEYPVIGEIKDVMSTNGAMVSLMSGSGPTVFGLFEDEKAAKRCYEQLRFGQMKTKVKEIYLTGMHRR